MPLVAGGAAAAPPEDRCQISAGLRDCIFASDYERRVLITRKYAGIRVVDRYRFPNRFLKNFVTYKNLFRDLLWLYLWLFVVSSLAPLFEVIIFLLFEPFGVDVELSS